MIEQHLSNCLRSALKERNWSQSDGAAAAQISERMLKYIMAGEKSPSLRTLEKIAHGWQYPEIFSDLGLNL